MPTILGELKDRIELVLRDFQKSGCHIATCRHTDFGSLTCFSPDFMGFLKKFLRFRPTVFWAVVVHKAEADQNEVAITPAGNYKVVIIMVVKGNGANTGKTQQISSGWKAVTVPETKPL